jgi:prevent-host-death family protein
MVDATLVNSLSDFQRNAKSYIRKLKKSGRPAVLTVNGRAEVVVQSAEAYQKLMDELELLESVRDLRRGLEEVARGEVRPAREFLNELAARFGYTLKP